MNSLSWFIYFAGVASGVSNCLLWISLIYIVILFIISVAASEAGDGAGEQVKVFMARFKWGFISVVLFLMAALIPSKETMYAIAASELGEKLLHTETVSKAQKALEAWLDSQTKQLVEKDK